MDDARNRALRNAVLHSNVDEVREQLEGGADPEILSHDQQSLLHHALWNNNVDITKLLVKYGAQLDYGNMRFILGPKNRHRSVEIVTHMIEANSDAKFINNVFSQLLYDGEEDLSLEILKIILDRGLLPVNDYTDAWNYTPLHSSIRCKRFDFISLLLEHGADIHKRTSKGQTPLDLAIYTRYDYMVKFLLKNGAEVNETSLDGRTALHVACQTKQLRIVKMLLKHGADVNVLDDDGNTPLDTSFSPECAKEVVKEISRLIVENRPVCSENLSQLKSRQFEIRQCFENCTNELNRMMIHEFHSGLSLYDILRMRKQREKLTLLTKNEDLVEAFRSCWKREWFENYGDDLDDIFNEALERRDLLVTEEEKLYSVFKDYLPVLVTRKLAYYVKEDLFFE